MSWKQNNEWNDDDEIEMLSPQIEGRLHLEYTYHSIVWQFLQLSFKTNWLKTGWLKSHKANSFWIAIPILCCILISHTLFDALHRIEARVQLKCLTFDLPLSAVLKTFPINFDDDQLKIQWLYGCCIGIILKQVVGKIWISLTHFYTS